MEELKTEITEVLIEKIYSEASKIPFLSGNCYSAVAKALKKIASQYEVEGILKNESINPFMDTDQIQTLIESNSMGIAKLGFVAIIPVIGEMYKVACHYGTSKNMLIKSGKTERQHAKDIMNNYVTSMLRDGIKPDNIEVFVPFEGFTD